MRERALSAGGFEVITDLPLHPSHPYEEQSR
jgi:hypothetical protein